MVVEIESRHDGPNRFLFPVPSIGGLEMRHHRAMIPLLFLTAAGFVRAEDKAADSAGVEFFERKVRPILVDSCFQCHSAQSKSLKGGLRLDSRDTLLKGGDSGPAIELGAPEKSLLIKAIGYRDIDLQMPPKGRLRDAAIADLTAWVKMGAP